MTDKVAVFNAMSSGDYSVLTDEQHVLAGAMLAAGDARAGRKLARAAAEGRLSPAATRAIRDANVCLTPYVRRQRDRVSHLGTLIAMTGATYRPARRGDAGRRDARPAARRSRSAARGSARSGDSDDSGPPDDEGDGAPASRPTGVVVCSGPGSPR